MGRPGSGLGGFAALSLLQYRLVGSRPADVQEVFQRLLPNGSCQFSISAQQSREMGVNERAAVNSWLVVRGGFNLEIRKYRRALASGAILLLITGCETTGGSNSPDPWTAMGDMLMSAAGGMSLGHSLKTGDPSALSSYSQYLMQYLDVRTGASSSDGTGSYDNGGSSDARAGFAGNSGSGFGDDCGVVPPHCSQANSRAEQLINKFPQTTGIYDSASQMYCALLVGIEVNSFCASEYRKEGREACAQLLDQQVAAYEENRVAAKRTIQASSISQIRRACSWER